MLQMAQLFKNTISLTELLQMPLRMVHTLRDVRIEQLEREKAEANKQASNSNSNNQFSGNSGVDLAAMEEFIEEHSS